MNSPDLISLRLINEADLPLFYEHQLDQGAVEMVGLPSRDHDAFFTHWAGVMINESIILRTILVDGQTAGYLTCFVREELRQVGYWLGRDFWGKGIATRSLQLFLPLIPDRPLYAFTSPHNQASQKVLLHNNFKSLGESDGLLKFEFI